MPETIMNKGFQMLKWGCVADKTGLSGGALQTTIDLISGGEYIEPNPHLKR